MTEKTSTEGSRHHAIQQILRAYSETSSSLSSDADTHPAATNAVATAVPLTQSIFDREAMLRVIFAHKLDHFLSGGVFYIDLLRPIRQIAFEILDMRYDPRSAVSMDLDCLHCVRFDMLSAIDLFASLESVCRFIRLSGRTGRDLLGDEGWTATKHRIQAICDRAPDTTKSTLIKRKPQELDPWAVDATFSHMQSIFGGKNFNITPLDATCDAIAVLRTALGMPKHDYRATQTHSVLRTLHCVDFSDMPPSVLDGLGKAVREVISLDVEAGEAIFGSARWTDFCTMNARQTITGMPESGKVGGSNRWFARPWSKPFKAKLCLALLSLAFFWLALL